MPRGCTLPPTFEGGVFLNQTPYQLLCSHHEGLFKKGKVAAVTRAQESGLGPHGHPR